MKKFCLLWIALVGTIAVRAQLSESEKNAALQLVSNHSAEIGLSGQDVQNSIVSASYTTKSGIRMVYLQQSFRGIPVYNQLQVLAFKGDKLVSSSGSRVPNAEERANNATGEPSISAAEAVRSAIIDRKLATAMTIYQVGEKNNRLLFGKLDVSDEDITAELVWLPAGKHLDLCWQVFIAPSITKDMWLIRVDAQRNVTIDRSSLTVHDRWEKSGNKTFTVKENRKTHFIGLERKAFSTAYHPTIINTGTYRVVPYPAESPIHPGGTPTLVTNPWLAAPGNATSLKWNNDGSSDYNSSRGNNVYAQEDRDANNNTFGNQALATSQPDPLIFDYTPDFTTAPTLNTNQQFAITNLFYWNNIIHDISYIYGFDEVSGNFQTDNQGRGGLGVDYVIADAQDAGGINNANFSTPVDGSRPRMQMYLFNYTTPQRDGDVDNGVVSHEFTHGVSNRLTGGPNNTSCLGNAEQGGEGWSDYFAMMVTTNWATSTINDGLLPHPIGNYVLGQPITGAGIRTYPYSTDMNVDPWTYALLPSTGGEPHNVGEVWCTALWEMTWEMIQLDGINPNLYNPTGTGGNSAALKLVIEGMRLQPCGPGFLDARNAILKADTLFFAAHYSCAIWKAFAKRGMGRYAQQGSSNAVGDEIADYTVDAGGLTVNQASASVPETQNIVYTNRVTAGNCVPVTNYYLTDTLPSGITYVSGGSYNTINRVVTFNPITLSPGQTQTYPFTVNVNAGTWFAPVDHLTEPVASGTIPATWTPSSTTASVWTVSSAQFNSSPNAFFAPEPTIPSDEILATTGSYTLIAGQASFPTLSFWHKYNTEAGYDGAVIEISSNNGVSWGDLGSKIIKNGYNATIPTTDGSPIGGRKAWSGNSNTWIQTVVDLRTYAGQTVKIRFRMASDNGTSGSGWYVDDILLRSEPAIFMRTSLFNSSNVRQTYSDTITQITNSCLAATISTQPANTAACLGNNASVTVVTTGSGLTYQWQVNTGSGFTNITNGGVYSGATTTTLNITGVTAGMAGYQYRVVINGTCTPAAVTSNTSTLSINTTPSITNNPNDVTACAAGVATFTVGVSGSSLTYQWQVNTGSGFTNLSNGAPYSGVTTAVLTVSPLTAAMNNYQYRVIVSSTGCTSSATSATGSLTITTAPSITGQPAGTAVCPGASYTFTSAASGSAISYQWQVSTNGGTSFTDIPGANTQNYLVSGITVGMNANQYRAVVTGACAPNATTNAATLTVYTPAAISTQPVAKTTCAGTNTSFAVTAIGTSISYQWQVSTDNGATYNNITGATAATLPINNPSTTLNGNRYRVVVTGNCGLVTSASASLTVNPLPVFTISVPATLCVSDTAAHLQATLAGGTWSGTGVQGTNFNPAVSGLGNFPVTYTVTNGFGCTNTATSNVQVNECPERHRTLNTKDAVILFPNPNNGNFQVRMNSDLYTSLGLRVYSAEGRFVHGQVFSNLRFGTLMPVHIRNLEAGLYFIELYNGDVRTTLRVVVTR